MVVALGTMLVYSVRPQTVDEAVLQLRANRTRSAVVGFTVMVGLWLLSYLLGNAFCLAILSIVPGAVALGAGCNRPDRRG